jgi:predicted AlkP superfamily pyrophosphatase or phosphodiesterase
VSPLLLALALVAAPGGRAAPPAAVLIVSVDALHPEALARAPMARVLRAAQGGQSTLLGRSTSPPKTLVAHTAMLTGLAPEASGKTDNDWEPGEPTVEARTLFDVAKEAGYRTAYFYSKEKLGYLASPAVDVHALAPGDGAARAGRFLSGPGPAFVVLHVSGLEYAGMKSGWLSPVYLAEARAIDGALAPLLDALEARGRYLLVVTSDHAGHATAHGTAHPDDGRRPVVLRSDVPGLLPERGPPPGITELMPLVAGALRGAAR